MNNSKIKICYVANADITIKFILLNHLKFLKDEGYDVYAVCSDGKWIKDIEKEGIKVKIINFRRKISPIFDLIHFSELFFYFKKEKFQIVHTHNPKPSLLGQSAAKIAGIPSIVNTIHGLYFNETSSFLRKKFFILTEKISALFSDLIFSVSEEDVRTIIKENICSPQKVKHLGNGIDLQRFSPEKFSKEFINKKKEELGIDPHKKIIGIVGRLVKEKGYLDLFKAFKKVLESFNEVVLLIIGQLEPEKNDALNPSIVKKYAIEKNVIFLGERGDIEEIYPLMDIFVLPSHREGLPYCLLETSALARPIVATNIRGCREAIENGETGILVPYKNPEKLAEALIFLIENPKRAKDMGENARKKAEKEFDENKIFGIIKREYQVLREKKLR